MSNPSTGASSKSKVGSSQPSETSFKRKRGVFQKDLQHMMYGFGDDPNVSILQNSNIEPTSLFLMNAVSSVEFFDELFMHLRLYNLFDHNYEFQLLCFQPLPETVALVEDIVVEYVTDMAHKAQDIGSKRGKLSVEDFLYLIRKDLPKLNRCTELLSMQEELKQARKAFEVDEEKLGTLE
ncbi:hypothetical protein Gotur_019883 [Gossypium turneri]